jgi:SNF2 family DNA or RNA helicase
MTAIHAELTAGREQIVLVAGGSELEVATAAKQLKTLTPLFARSDPPGALTVPLTWPAVVQLQAAFADTWRPGPRLCAWITEQVAARTQAEACTADGTAHLSYTAPAGLTPYPWQSAGAAIIAGTGRALITDEPGTGKTITTILGLVEFLCEGPDRTGTLIGPVIVICPASVVDPWVEAWSTWAPHVTAVAWRGAPKSRHALAGTADIYVTSYETARMDAGVTRTTRALYDMSPTAVVVDECHLIKNPHTERSKAVRRLAKIAQGNDGAVVALSGTPITHHPGDLWPALSALEADAWPSRERWVQRYCQSVPGDYREEILGLHPATEPEFRLTLLGQHRRVAKADVLTELPPKVYSVRTVELPATWRKAYDAMESQMLAELPDGQELSVMSVLAQLTRLSQLAAAAADVKVTTETDAQGLEREHVEVKLKAPSWKVDALLEILEERPGEPVVVFAPSRQLIMLAGEAAAKAGLRVGYVVGGQSMTERTATVEAFQSGALDLICVTTGAGGVGLTLTAARTCVFLQRPWSLVEAMQAEDRCHRIGSEHHDSVEVIDIVALKTIDTRVRAVLRTRAGQLSDLVQDPRIVADLLGGTGAPSTTTERKAS